QLADPETALAMLLPLTRRSEQGGSDFAHRRYDLAETRRQRFTGQLIERRLGIEGIEVAWPAFHEEEDASFRPGVVMWPLGSEWAGVVDRSTSGLGRGFFGHQCRKCYRAEAAPGAGQPLAAGTDRFRAMTARIVNHVVVLLQLYLLGLPIPHT